MRVEREREMVGREREGGECERGGEKTKMYLRRIIKFLKRSPSPQKLCA